MRDVHGRYCPLSGPGVPPAVQVAWHNGRMTAKNSDVGITGGGIGGWAAALALSCQGLQVQVLEQATAYAEVGAGVQLGPNVTRVLHAWGLQAALAELAFEPLRLQARDARSGEHLGELPLLDRMQARYGAPYVCIHRADLHALLRQAALAAGAQGLEGVQVAALTQDDAQVLATDAQGRPWVAAAWVGADGVWSTCRQALGLHEPPRALGHTAYRALVPMARLPEGLRTAQVTVWMGPRLHVVMYPVQAGRLLNLVAVLHGQNRPLAPTWEQEGAVAALWASLGPVCRVLGDTLRAVPDDGWRSWPLMDRPPVRGAQHMAQGRVALLGDAAHPMRPYLAQGAGMAIEDAQALALCLTPQTLKQVPQALAAYAQRRHARNARVQARSVRNGWVFAARGPLAWGRNALLRAMGPTVMDVPWLYGGQA